MPRIVVTATIPAGQSVSSSIDLSAGTAVFCHMPDEWTPALLSFLISHDNVSFGDLVDESTREVSLNVIPGTVIRIGAALLIPAEAGWLKLRSGSRGGAVIQTAERNFIFTAVT